MKQPEGFGDGTTRVCRLLKALYGLKQSPRVWNKTCNDYLETKGFKASTSDPCLYVKKEGGKISYLALYVDDMLLIAKSMPEIEWMKNTLSQKFRMKNLGE